jgi:lysophospholipase L1-like esterase
MTNYAKNLVLAVSAVVVMAMWGFVITANAAPAPSANVALAVQPAPARQLQVAFLGDSYTGGSAMSSGIKSLYPTLLAGRFNFLVDNFAVGGSGFVAPGQTNQPFGLRVRAVVAAHPDVVVVQGGHNDANSPQDQVQAAAQSVLASLQAGLPKAKIIVIGPIWPSGDVPQSELSLDGALKQMAVDMGARFIDPIADGWFIGPYTKLIGSDGTHPTDAGHARIAKLLGPVFAATIPKAAS